MGLIAPAVYLLCAATSFFCMMLLLRTYVRNRRRLLFWSTLCFVGLAINNLLLFLDLVMLPHISLVWPRNLVALVSVAVLLYGLVLEADDNA